MLTSMTGFIREEKLFDWARLVIELRCVNSRYLDVNTCLPDELRSFEFELKKQLANKLFRGKLGINIQLLQTQSSAETINYDKAYAKKIATTLHEIDRFIYNASPVKAIDILTWPGVINSCDNISNEQKADIFTLFDKAIYSLQQVRQREGSELSELLLQRCDKIEVIISQINTQLDSIIEKQREKLKNRLNKDLLESLALDNTRLEQEIILFVQKMDISEEIDRLTIHIKEVRRIIKAEQQTGAQGRQLDFLMQELNREANTIGSKSASVETSKASVELKVQIEQMREQIQNIE